MIDRIGLLRADAATERNVQLAYRHYRCARHPRRPAAFARANCHPTCHVEMVGVWDTVKALVCESPCCGGFAWINTGFTAITSAAPRGTGFMRSPSTRRGGPIRPSSGTYAGCHGHVEQVWFRGCHSDVGGQLCGRHGARPLSNISLVWMLERVEACDLPLPEGWRARFTQDVTAPSVGTWVGWGKILLRRRARVVGRDPSERLHDSVRGTVRIRRLGRLRAGPLKEPDEGVI